MSLRKICILGGTGFIGRSIVLRLVDAGHEVRVITRNRERHRDLLVLPTLQLIEADVHNRAVLVRELRGVDTVINLVGILNERGHRGRGFERAHVELPRKVVDACIQVGVKRLLHMCALNASLDAPSLYLRTKARGEDLVHQAPGLEVTSFRPSVIFGPRDSFTNRFAHLLRLSPMIFPLACPEARFQPIYVEDVARAYVWSLDHRQSMGQRYDLCGPAVYTLYEVVSYIAQLIGVRRKIIRLNNTVSWLQAATLEYFPGKPFSLDNFRSLQRDAVCTQAFPSAFGFSPTRMESVVPTYLHR